jgi:hypothetical protein
MIQANNEMRDFDLDQKAAHPRRGAADRGQRRQAAGAFAQAQSDQWN